MCKEVSIELNNVDIDKVHCSKFLGVYIDCKLKWFEHVNSVRTKIVKNLSVMRRVKWLLNESAMYTLYCSLILPYITYCCEIRGNTYKNRIQPLYTLQKHAMRMCGQLEYRAHSKPGFVKSNALTIFDVINIKSMVIMYKIYNNLMPVNILSHFEMVNTCHDYNTRQENNFKNKYCRTILKSMCISVKGPKMWNSLNKDLKNSSNIHAFKISYKHYLVNKYNT